MNAYYNDGMLQAPIWNKLTFCPSIWVHVETGSGVISQSSIEEASSKILMKVDFPVATRRNLVDVLWDFNFPQ